MMTKHEARGSARVTAAFMGVLASCYVGVAEVQTPDEGRLFASQFVEAMATDRREHLTTHACEGFSIETFDMLMTDVGDVVRPILDDLSASLVHNAELSDPGRLVFDAIKDGNHLRASVLLGEQPCVIVEVLS